jgi:hypothetical protein
MSSKGIEIFKEASNSLKKSLKCHAFLKKTAHSQKKPSGNFHIATIASLPLSMDHLNIALAYLRIIIKT